MSKDWQKKALELREEGYSNRAIGRKLGKDESVVRRYFKRLGETPKAGDMGTPVYWDTKLGDFTTDGETKWYLNTAQQEMLNEDHGFKMCGGDGFQIGGKGPGSKAWPMKIKPLRVEDNSRVLLISDPHFPYSHPDIFEFLQHLKDKYKPTRVICMGDEVDHIGLNYHEKENNAPSANDEIKLFLPMIKRLEEMFPVMDILDSNHGSLVYRKAKTAGIPKHYIKSYGEMLGVGPGWKWHFDLVIDLPGGNSCYLHHGKSANITKTSQAMSMCAAAGHYHNTFKIEYWANPKGLYWAMQTGCLIDDKSFAFNYNNVNIHRPLIGTGLIIDGLPVLEPMVLDKGGRWIGR